MGANRAINRGHGPLLRVFELFQFLLERVELFARSSEHRFLHLEFLARDEVELRETLRENRTEVLLQLLTHGAKVSRHCIRKASGQLADTVPVHGLRPIAAPVGHPAPEP